MIIVSSVIDDSEFNFHHNVLISNDSTFEDYYNAIKNIVNMHYEHGYPVDIIQSFKIRVWNIDNLENKNIKLTSSAINNKLQHNTNKSIIKRSYYNKATIKPLKNGFLDKDTCKLISTMDIETITFNNKQIPICISTSYNFNSNKLFLIEYNLLQTDMVKAVNNLWKNYFDFITKNTSYFENIFVHNLGSFDGYFLYKALLNNFNPPMLIL